MIDGEKNLIERAKSGDSEAFGILYDCYQPQIYRFVYIKVSQKEDAEDLTHQVFLNAWRGIDDYKHQGFPFSSWLYRIARNQIIDFYRNRKDVVAIESVEEIVEDSSSPAETADFNMMSEKVMALIQELTHIEQDVIILRFIEEKSHDEVAKAIGKTPMATRLIQHRAINNLKKILDKKHGSAIK